MTVSCFSNNIFSSAISDIQITTTDTKVVVTLVDITNDHAITLLQVTLDTFNGGATLYDTREAIEDYMKTNRMPFLSVGIQIEGVNEQAETFETDRDVVFCDNIISGNTADRFLTSLNSKCIPRDQMDVVYFFHPTNGSITEEWKFFTTADGGQTIESNEVERQTGELTSGVLSTHVSYDFLRNEYHMTNQLVAAILTIGNRSMTFYYVDDEPDLVLSFRNAFNVPERAFLHGVTKSKTASQKSTATCGGIDSFYDITNSIEYQFETAPIDLANATWLQQLVLSDYITINSQEVLITEHSCEVSDADDELNTVKFTYQHTDGRPRIDLSIPRQIFNDNFSKEFQ